MTSLRFLDYWGKKTCKVKHSSPLFFAEILMAKKSLITTTPANLFSTETKAGPSRPKRPRPERPDHVQPKSDSSERWAPSRPTVGPEQSRRSGGKSAIWRHSSNAASHSAVASPSVSVVLELSVAGKLGSVDSAPVVDDVAVGSDDDVADATLHPF